MIENIDDTQITNLTDNLNNNSSDQDESEQSNVDIDGYYEIKNEDNNDIEKTFTIKNGKIDGNFCYFENKNLICKIMFKDGKMNGTMECFQLDQKILSANYVDGVLDGQMQAFSNNKVVSSIVYKNGKKHGPSETFYPSGKLMKQEIYCDGILQSDIQKAKNNQDSK